MSLSIVACLLGCNDNEKSINGIEENIEIHGTHLFVKVIGNGDPVMVVHGGPGLSHNYMYGGLLSLTDQF